MLATDGTKSRSYAPATPEKAASRRVPHSVVREADALRTPPGRGVRSSLKSYGWKAVRVKCNLGDEGPNPDHIKIFFSPKTAAKSCPGVYVIQVNGRPVYAGMSTHDTGDRNIAELMAAARLYGKQPVLSSGMRAAAAQNAEITVTRVAPMPAASKEAILDVEQRVLNDLIIGGYELWNRDLPEKARLFLMGKLTPPKQKLRCAFNVGAPTLGRYASRLRGKMSARVLNFDAIETSETSEPPKGQTPLFDLSLPQTPIKVSSSRRVLPPTPYMRRAVSRFKEGSSCAIELFPQEAGLLQQMWQGAVGLLNLAKAD